MSVIVLGRSTPGFTFAWRVKPTPPRQPQWRCNDCGSMNDASRTSCRNCQYPPKPRPIPPGKAS